MFNQCFICFVLILQFDEHERSERERSMISITPQGWQYRQFDQHKLTMCYYGWDASQLVALWKFIKQKINCLSLFICSLIMTHIHVRKFDAHQLRLEEIYSVAKKIIVYSANRRSNEALISLSYKINIWKWTANSPIRGMRTPLKLLQKISNSNCVDCRQIQPTMVRAAVRRIKSALELFETKSGCM